MLAAMSTPRLPEHVLQALQLAEASGHCVISRGGGGGGLFKCTRCEHRTFLDGSKILPPFPAECQPKKMRRRTPLHVWLDATTKIAGVE